MSNVVTTKTFAIEKNIYVKYMFLYTVLRYIYVIIPCIILILLSIILKFKYILICSSIFFIIFILYFILRICIITYSHMCDTLFDKYCYKIKDDSLYIYNNKNHFSQLKNDKSVVVKQYKNRYIFFINHWIMFYIDEKKFASQLEFQVFKCFVEKNFSQHK